MEDGQVGRSTVGCLPKTALRAVASPELSKTLLPSHPGGLGGKRGLGSKLSLNITAAFSSGRNI